MLESHNFANTQTVGFLNASFTTTLATAGTALLSLSFVFSATAAEVLGSCIFLFVKHPFDVGDRVDIQDISLTVEHISLLYSVFKRVDTHKTVQIPNIVLNTVWIENVTRSKAMRERISMFISFDTSLEDITALKMEMQAFVGDKDNSRDFQSEVEVEVVGLAEMNKLELRVEVRHKVYIGSPLPLPPLLLILDSPIGQTKSSEPRVEANSCVLSSLLFAKFPSMLLVVVMLHLAT